MERVVELSSSRTLTIRPVHDDDLDRLGHLYDQLSPDDLRRRFFSVVPAPRRFLERWIRRTSEEGCCLVAEVHDSDDGGHEIVADAGYVLLPDRSGELAITVHPRWRGWLGHYLLDALIEAAAERGVPCLQADVLLENRQMLSLLNARGYATIDHPDWNTIRVVVGTTERTPAWPGEHDRPRVLVEVPGARWHAEQAALDAGYQVMSCPGPRPGPGGHCPVLEGHSCPLAEGADAIVFSLSMEGPGQEILAQHRARLPETPVCLSSIRSRELEEFAGDVDAVEPVTRDLEPLLATLERLTGGPPHPESAGDDQ